MTGMADNKYFRLVIQLSGQKNLYLARKGEASKKEASAAGKASAGHGKKKFNLILGFLLIFAAVNFLLLFFLNSSHFEITGIYIEGLEKVTREQVHESAGISEGMNIWEISPPEIVRRLEEIPRVEEAKVGRNLPGGIHIIITEKRPLALVPYHGYYLELASDGIFIGIRNDYRGELLLVNGLVWGHMDVGTGIPDRVRGEILEEVLDSLVEMPALPLAEINVEEPQQIVGYSPEGMEIRFGDGKELSKKMEVFDNIYYRIFSKKESLEGYLDVRVAEKPVFKPAKNNY